MANQRASIYHRKRVCLTANWMAKCADNVYRAFKRSMIYRWFSKRVQTILASRWSDFNWKSCIDRFHRSTLKPGRPVGSRISKRVASPKRSTIPSYICTCRLSLPLFSYSSADLRHIGFTVFLVGTFYFSFMNSVGKSKRAFLEERKEKRRRRRRGWKKRKN